MKTMHTILGFLGLIPFIGLSALSIANWHAADFMLASYSALIISFLAGALWTWTLVKTQPTWLSVVSNLIMLVSWLLLWLAWHGAGANIFFALAALLITLNLVEYQQLKNEIPSNYLTFRIRLTLIASLSLLSAAVLN
ncbi:hypothetical protein THMIRHAS_18380 [Thiosulfatimonas sediminis]|uniref:DUF3429 domain-containing protein n=1 Tax=Thiosulfatimonas sediminis TaxID=2675054 RepID=A0A6F8PWG9_9GAMM|nr:DUF3429 domain-containing protein [Thiosulfatimonas sediminis]BBP46465.1 hypothetical protein THMIRHAS_18380 [Thiosulfatimonas sediminis]